MNEFLVTVQIFVPKHHKLHLSNYNPPLCSVFTGANIVITITYSNSSTETHHYQMATLKACLHV